jgi:WW domain
MATATPPSDPPEQIEQPESNDESQQPAENVPPASSSLEPASPSSADWRAIWSSAHNAYYFYNTLTQQTTWVNPLQPAQESSVSSTPASTSTLTPTSNPTSTSTSTSTSTPPPPSAPTTSTQEESSNSSAPGPSSSGATPVPASIAQIYALQEAAAAQGIDPSLAHLDPSLAGPSSAPGATAYNFSARFNAHTGAFTRPDGRDPTHLSEYDRMKRMSSVYFDMGQWEEDVAQRKEQEDEDAANGKKRKRPSKKDLVGLSPLSLFFVLVS